MNQPISPSSAEIAEAIANQRPTLFIDGQVNPACTLGDLLRELVEHNDMLPSAGISAHIAKHALDDLGLIGPLTGMDGAMFGADVSRLADRASMWLRLGPEIERRMANESEASKCAPPIAEPELRAKPQNRSDSARNPWSILADLYSILHELRHNFDTVWCNAREAFEGNEDLRGTAKILDDAAHKVLADVQAAKLYVHETHDWLRETGVEMECVIRYRERIAHQETVQS